MRFALAAVGILVLVGALVFWRTRTIEPGVTPVVDAGATHNNAPTPDPGKPRVAERVYITDGGRQLTGAELDDLEHEQLKLKIMHDPDPEEREDAIRELRADDDKDARDVLVAAMSDRVVEVRRAAVEALRDYTEQLSVAEVAPALKDPDPEVRLEALYVLEDMEGPGVLPAVRTLLKDKDEDVRDHAKQVVQMLTQH